MTKQKRSIKSFAKHLTAERKSFEGHTRSDGEPTALGPLQIYNTQKPGDDFTNAKCMHCSPFFFLFRVRIIGAR